MVRYVRFAIGVLLLGAACTTPSATLRADTTAYLDKMSSWGAMQAETARALDRIVSTNFVDDAEVLRQLADSSPRVARHLHEAQQYQPRTLEIRHIHDTYVHAWQSLLDGYASIEAGLLGGDQRSLSKGRDSLLRWRASIRAVARQLRDLSDRVGVVAAAVRDPMTGRGQTPREVRPLLER